MASSVHDRRHIAKLRATTLHVDDTRLKQTKCRRDAAACRKLWRSFCDKYNISAVDFNSSYLCYFRICGEPSHFDRVFESENRCDCAAQPGPPPLDFALDIFLMEGCLAD